MESFEDFLKKTQTYHETLNPKLWDENKQLKPEVSEKLLQIASRFMESLRLDSLQVEDIVLTGSNANYNWTSHSDLDVHLLLNNEACEDCQTPELEDCIQAKKILWNDRHEINIYGIPVEIYATTRHEELVKDSGTYSLQHYHWIAQPQRKELSLDSASVIAKSQMIMAEIDQAIDSKTNDEQDLQEILDKIAQMRQSGLDSFGEFSVENLTFKVLRTNGYLDKIKGYFKQVQDHSLSLG